MARMITANELAMNMVDENFNVLGQTVDKNQETIAVSASLFDTKIEVISPKVKCAKKDKVSSQINTISTQDGDNNDNITHDKRIGTQYSTRDEAVSESRSEMSVKEDGTDTRNSISEGSEDRYNNTKFPVSGSKKDKDGVDATEVYPDSIGIIEDPGSENIAEVQMSFQIGSSAGSVCSEDTRINDASLKYTDETEFSMKTEDISENVDIDQEEKYILEADEPEIKEEIDENNVNGNYVVNTEKATAKKKRTKRTSLTLKEKLTCPTCGKKFTNQSNRLAHEKMVHRKMRHKLCTVCDKGFYSSSSLKKHMNKHTGERPYKCPICDKGFTQPCNVKRHMESHSLVGNYECPICQRMFKEKGNMKRHIETHGDKKTYTCTICSKAFRMNSNRRRHEETVHSEQANYFCDICNKAFSCADSVKLHMKIHTGERNFLCPKCGKRFITRGALRRHLPVHDADEENKYQCGFCMKLFKTAKTLTSHMSVHTGYLTHFCHICNKGFAKACVLKKHVQTHSKERPHVCQVCDKDFTNEYSLKRHFAIHGTEKPYGCELCDKKFLYGWYLNEHMNVHLRYRSLDCFICNKGFANKMSLKIHMTIHTGEKKYHCSLCNKSFSEQGSYKRHGKSRLHKRTEEKEMTDGIMQMQDKT